MIPLKDENPASRKAVVTWGLILANLAVFIYMLTLSGAALESFVYRFSVIPWEISKGSQLPPGTLYQLLGTTQALPAKNVYLSLLTCVFLHSGWLHIGFNMLFLAIFGNNVEDAMGHLPFLAFYLVCGIAASLAQTAVNTNSVTPTVGASGAIAGVMGAYLVLYPRARILTLVLIFVVYVPAWAFIGIWVAYQLLSATESISGVTGGVAWFAHLGGIAAGTGLTLMAYPLLRRRTNSRLAEGRRGGGPVG
jgi:membrane associated rhomboid family serine protease